eukprot:scaffold4062_cov137-Cylindrotheca_fusiformis.AAC.8
MPFPRNHSRESNGCSWYVQLGAPLLLLVFLIVRLFVAISNATGCMICSPSILRIHLASPEGKLHNLSVDCHSLSTDLLKLLIEQTQYFCSF